jgi:hypothetical protein
MTGPFKKLLDCQNYILNKMLVLTVLLYLDIKNFRLSVPSSKSSYKIYLGYVFIFNHGTKNVLNHSLLRTLEVKCSN